MDEKNEEFDKKLIIQMIHDLNESLNQITLKSLGLNKAAAPKGPKRGPSLYIYF